MKTLSRLYRYIFSQKHKDSAFRVSSLSLVTRFSLLLLLVTIIPMLITAWWIEAGYLMPGENAYIALPLFFLILIIPCARLLSNWVINRDIETINKFCLEVKKGNYRVHFELAHEGDEEEPLVILLRNLTWMTHTLNSRQEKTRTRLHRVQREHRIMKEKALLDGLTGLYNRRYFEEIFPEVLEVATIRKIAVSLIFIDCDKFKHLNDTLGHQTGDIVLERLADNIRAAVRQGRDIPFRFGGDEFAVLLQGVDLELSTQIAERIRSLFIDSSIGDVTLSLGVATALPAGDVGDGWIMKSLVRVADQQTYRAKEMGGNNVCPAEYVITDNKMENLNL